METDFLRIRYKHKQIPKKPVLFTWKCRLLITFANSLEPDQVEENVRPDPDPNCLTPDHIPEGFFLKMLILKEKKNQQMTKNHEKYTKHVKS